MKEERKGNKMKIQAIKNQQTFTANAQFRPIAPKKLRGFLGLFGDFATERTSFFKNDTDRIICSLQDEVKQGNIKRSSKMVDTDQFKYYQDKKVFEMNGDTVILFNKPVNPQSAPSAIYIAHEAEGKQGSTEIFRYYLTSEDTEYDKLSKMLNELQE